LTDGHLADALAARSGAGPRGRCARVVRSPDSRRRRAAYQREERIELIDAETRRLQALAALDVPGANISKWVADFRASFRYFAVSGIVLATLAAVFLDVEGAALMALFDLTGAAMSFIIGERMYLHLRR
jgi:hypothetical protein